MSGVRERDLFAAVVSASGVSPILAPGTVRRALRDVGSTPQKATSSTYLEALPSMRARLRAFMSPEEAERATDHIRRIVQSHDNSLPAD
ncbi:MAG: hypothetical protein AAGA56_00835 [Myxococcota bacterium]